MRNAGVRRGLDLAFPGKPGFAIATGRARREEPEMRYRENAGYLVLPERRGDHGVLYRNDGYILPSKTIATGTASCAIAIAAGRG